MANIGKMFDPNQQEPSTVGGGILPVSDKTGWPMVVTASEMKETKAKNGDGYLEVTVQIIEGEHSGKEGEVRFNLFNKNEQTMRIAEKDLTALAYSIGIFQPFADSAILHNRPFRGIVGLQKVKAGDEEKGFTEIKGFLDIGGNSPKKGGSAPAAAPAAPPQPPAAPAGSQFPVQTPAGAAPAQWGPPAAPVEASPAAPAWGQPAAAAPAAASPPWAVKP